MGNEPGHTYIETHHQPSGAGGPAYSSLLPGTVISKRGLIRMVRRDLLICDGYFFLYFYRRFKLLLNGGIYVSSELTLQRDAAVHQRFKGIVTRFIEVG